MDAGLVAAVLTDNRRAEVQMGARLLREQELSWLFAASAAGGSTPLMPDLRELGFDGAVRCWSCSEAFNLANAHFDSRPGHSTVQPSGGIWVDTRRSERRAHCGRGVRVSPWLLDAWQVRQVPSWIS